MSKQSRKDTIERSPTLSGEYSETIQNHHHTKIWGASAVKWSGPDVEKLLSWKRYNVQTALDYGCGQHVLATEFPQVNWTGYDPGIPERAEKPDGKFDLVVCSDVMEHVEEDYVEAVLQEIADYAKQVVFLNIACAPANDRFQSGPRKGKDVHITVKHPTWWEEKVRALDGIHVQEVHALGRQIRGQWRDRVKILIEKL